MEQRCGQDVQAAAWCKLQVVLGQQHAAAMLSRADRLMVTVSWIFEVWQSM